MFLSIATYLFTVTGAEESFSHVRSGHETLNNAFEENQIKHAAVNRVTLTASVGRTATACLDTAAMSLVNSTFQLSSAFCASDARPRSRSIKYKLLKTLQAGSTSS